MRACGAPRRWVLALAATVAAAGSARGAPAAKATCELARVDRARTPSHACLRCHDSSVGSAILSELRVDGTGASHPVGVDYARAAARSPTRYAPPESLPREVPLVNGKIECTTCHDASRPRPMRVDQSPALCTACHRI